MKYVYIKSTYDVFIKNLVHRLLNINKSLLKPLKHNYYSIKMRIFTLATNISYNRH